MSSARMLTPSIRTRASRGIVTVMALGALMLVPAPAAADPNLHATLTMPDSVTVGQTGLGGQVSLQNTSQVEETICVEGTPNCVNSEGIILFVSCAAFALAPDCDVPDSGVFELVKTIPLPFGCGTDPKLTSVGIEVVEAAQGKLRLVPDGPLVLAPGAGATSRCDIPLTFDVLKVPATDVDRGAAGTQTLQQVTATALFPSPVGGFPQETAAGTHTITVLPKPPVETPPVAPPPVAPPPVVAPPVVPPPVVASPPPPAVIQPTDLDHFKCYEALQPNFRQRTVGTRDQFGQRRTRVLRTRQLCNPVSKDGGRVLQPRAHLVCYETRDTGNATPPRTVIVTNQFGQRKLTTTRPNRLCVPSLKRKTAGAVPTTPDPTRLLDHFRCYDVQQQPAARTVKLVDQFGTTTTKVVRVIRLCNPVRKNNEPVRRAKSHLVCYSISDSPAFRPLAVRVRNQFGSAALRVRRPQTLCLPSFKQVVQTQAVSAAPPGLDHFKCYVAEQPQFQPRFVGLRDQFGQFESKVVATRQLCNPVRKNNGRVINPRAHLVCYETADAGTVPFGPREVRVSNQFGIRQLSVVKPVALCVPSLKRKGAGAAPTGPNPALVLDHFRCYDVKPQPAARTVKLADQFKTTKAKVLRVVRLCNPVRKNNEPVRRPQAHLVCYSIGEPPFQPLAVTIRNQFGVAGLRVRTPQMLCLPSLKKLVTAAGTEVDPANPA